MLKHFIGFTTLFVLAIFLWDYSLQFDTVKEKTEVKEKGSGFKSKGMEPYYSMPYTKNGSAKRPPKLLHPARVIPEEEVKKMSAFTWKEQLFVVAFIILILVRIFR